MDRYGEIDTTFKKWLSLLSKLPKMTVILNADDPSLAYLGSRITKHTVVYYGIKLPRQSKTSLKQSADAVFCPVCHTLLTYKSITFSHLGNYSCPCGFKRPTPSFYAESVNTSIAKTSFVVRKQKLEVPLLGMYNAYNALAAYCLSMSLGIEKRKAVAAIKQFKPVSGRQEVLQVKGKKVQLLLVKNPTGFDQVISTLQNFGKKITLCIAINDRIADGTDISWLWDVDFEQLKGLVKKIVVTGDRALDMGLRLKYAGFSPDQFIVETDRETALKVFLREKSSNLFLLPTYTALWELRKILTK